MSDRATLLALLDQAADKGAAAAVGALIASGEDRALARVNVLDLAKRTGVGEEAMIAAFLHASRLGLFDLSWNILCPGCSGVLEVGSSLRSVKQPEYTCALCAAGYETTLDELVEVTFTVNPRIRRIPAHMPDELGIWDYFRQVFWSSGIDLPDEAFDTLVNEVTLDFVELPAGERAFLSLDLPAEFVIVFDPVTHAAQFLDVKGEPTRERRAISVVLDAQHRQTETMTLAPGPVRVSFENRTGRRALPALWVAGDPLHDLLGRRRPFLTAKRLLSNQTFRDLYGTSQLDVDQRLKITSLTFVFTDLKGSTDLYDRVGDLVAYDVVRSHFRLLHEIVASEAGAVVKTIGDAVMATFPTPERGLAAALRMREAMAGLADPRLREELILKIGLHEGPCLAVNSNERQDYFGQTVNIAARIQSLASSRSIYASARIVEDAAAAGVIAAKGLACAPRNVELRGVAGAMPVYEIG
jgi:class 3 adenylate cyclase